MDTLVRLVDRMSDLAGWIAAVTFVLIGGMIGFEVVARYIFGTPTVWAEELSRFFQIWATYLAAAYVLRHRELIRITVLYDRLRPFFRRILDVLSLAVIVVFALTALVYGLVIVEDSVALARKTSTIMAVPRWMTEIAIPVGMLLLCLQALVELFRIVRPATSADTGEIGARQ